MSKEDLLKEARQAVLEGDEEAAEAVAKKVIAEGVNPVEIINEGLSPAMTEVGDGFANEEIPLPGVLVAADAAVAHEDCGSIVSSKGEPCVHNKSSTGDSSCPVA